MLEPCTHRRRNDDGITHVVARIYAQIGGHEALEAVVADFYPLSVLGTPRKGWESVVISVACPRRRPGLGRWGRGPGSRWSARSAARTNDLDAGGGFHRILPVGRTRVKALQFKPYDASACTEGSR